MRKTPSTPFPRWATHALLCSAVLGCGDVPHETLTVGAASSLRSVLPEIAEAFEARTGVTVVASYAASGVVSGQVEAGAPVDVVVLAGASPVERLIAAGLASAESLRVVATNELVLIGAPGAAPLGFSTLSKLPDDARLAIGDPAFVPVGRYARTVLETLGEWDALGDRLVFGGNVAAVLAYARRREVDAAIVYASDVVGVNDVVIQDRARAEWGVRPVVVAATVGETPHGRDFVTFLVSEAAGASFVRHGFGLP